MSPVVVVRRSPSLFLEEQRFNRLNLWLDICNLYVCAACYFSWKTVNFVLWAKLLHVKMWWINKLLLNLFSTIQQVALSWMQLKTFQNTRKLLKVKKYTVRLCVCAFVHVCGCAYINMCVHSVFSISMTTSISRGRLTTATSHADRQRKKTGDWLSCRLSYQQGVSLWHCNTHAHTHSGLSVPSTHTPTNCSKAQTKGTSTA